MGDHTKVSAPVIDLDQTEHIYDNRYKEPQAAVLSFGLRIRALPQILR
ncbi:MAG: hypothetical protein PVF14_17375 [Desulfobacterales bacterium]